VDPVCSAKYISTLRCRPGLRFSPLQPFEWTAQLRRNVADSSSAICRGWCALTRTAPTQAHLHSHPTTPAPSFLTWPQALQGCPLGDESWHIVGRCHPDARLEIPLGANDIQCLHAPMVRHRWHRVPTSKE